MHSKSARIEEMFLKLFKFVILAVMTLALVATVVALGYSVYQYNQSPKAPAPAQKAPEKQTNIDDFLKQLKSAPPQSPAPAPQEEPKAEAPAKSDPVKYKEEVKKIFECLRESNNQAKITSIDTGDEAAEAFRKQFQRVSDFKNADRGQPYATDAVRFACEVLKAPQVLAHRKTHQEADFFYEVVNFHIKAWDGLREEARKFEEEEDARVEREEREEDLRVALSKQQAKATLLVAGGAFLLFMALALYLIISAIESNLRRISGSIEKLQEDHGKGSAAPASNAS